MIAYVIKRDDGYYEDVFGNGFTRNIIRARFYRESETPNAVINIWKGTDEWTGCKVVKVEIKELEK